MKNAKLTDIFSKEQIKQAIKLRDRILIRDRLILPNIEDINKKTGQENDADYLSYLIVYVLRIK